MRPIVLDDEGIVEAIRHLISDEEFKSDLVVAFHEDVQFDRLEPKLEAAIFRVVQEALHNVKRHAQIGHAAVELTQEQGVVNVVVRDRGVGFDPQPLSSTSLGLRGIHERARLLGGASRIESAPGEGTTLRVRLPIVVEPIRRDPI
jgi:signal transduction histidine kinase